jgi:hypothetical protein
MRYNFACTLCQQLHDREAALEALKWVFANVSEVFLPYALADSDLDSLHDDPRWQAMVAAAEARIAAAKDCAAPAATG